MRMWDINPLYLCNTHLLAEHHEVHMLAGSIRKGISIQGYVDKGYVDTRRLNARHDELVKEMGIRGYVHRSPLPYIDTLDHGIIDPKESIRELASRCKDCRHQIILYGRYKPDQLPELKEAS